MPHHRSFLVVALSILCGGYACTEKVEGCLDVRASNFRPDADRDCCCIWPSVALDVDHRMGEENHFPDSVYLNMSGQSYRLLDAYLLLSDFRLHFQGREALPVWRDTIRLMNADSTFSWVRNEVIPVSRATNTIQIGRFVEEGQLDSISFIIGVPSGMNNYPPNAWPEGHPLRRHALYVWDSDMGYVSAATLHIPAPFADTIQWKTFQPIAVALSVDQVIAPGFSPAELRLRIDYLQWFAFQNVTASAGMPDDLWPYQIRASVH